jgi:peptidoglycan/xylan/chitin deacetylase (PgdA/CDA1 family)
MADHSTEGHEGREAGADPGDRRAELLARRERDRSQLRRRRLAAAGALAVSLAVVVTILAVVLGGDDSGEDPLSPRIPGTSASSLPGDAGSAGDRGTAGPVRNATPQPGWEPHTGPVPILEYHVLGAAPADAPYPELYVPRADFSREMDWLDENGFQAVTLEQVEDAWRKGGTLPAKPVVLSFDDGYRPQFTFALPELRRHGWAGLLNLKAEGSDLYPSNVEAMIDAGWELAAHTIHHLDLTTLDAAQLEEEVAGSRRILRREYGVPVRNFCYPAGRYDDEVIAAVESVGYAGATTEIPVYATREHPYELGRFEVLGSSGVTGIAEALASG